MKRALGLVPALLLLGAPPTWATVLFRGDFETGDLSQWNRVQAAAPDRVRVVTQPVRQGLFAARMEVRFGDLNSAGARAELVKSPLSTDAPGDERFFAWSTYFPPSYPSSKLFQVFFQFHHTGDTGSPPLELDVVGEEMHLHSHSFTGDITDLAILPFVRGVWHDFVVHIKYSSDPTVGFVEFWFDGKRVLPKKFWPTLFPGQFIYLKQGLYRHSSIVPTGVVFQDAMVEATALSDVLPGAGLSAAPVPLSGNFPEAGCSSAGGEPAGAAVALALLWVSLWRIRKRAWRRGAAGGLLALAILAAGPASAATTNRMSVSASGVQANDLSAFPALSNGGLSSDGRFVAFDSPATNLVPGDTNGVGDVFVRDRQGGTIERVSVSSSGAQGNDLSEGAAVSADGRFVAFASRASNLVAGDTNGFSDVLIHDRQTGATERVSVATGGGQANGPSYFPALSADGRFVAFASEATNLVSGDTNGRSDVFVRDRQTGTTERVSTATGGGQGNEGASGAAISADGRFVAFLSLASNLVAGDTNDAADVFVRDRQLGTTERVSVAEDGDQGNGGSVNPEISADGRLVVFVSDASNLVEDDGNNAADVFLRDRQTGTTQRVSISTGGAQGNGWSYNCAISADGHVVAFSTDASNLVSGDTNGVSDTFVHDLQTGVTERVSVASDGTQGNGRSLYPAINGNGLVVAFVSDASNLVPGDTNQVADAFVRDLSTFQPDLLVRNAGETSFVGGGIFNSSGSGQTKSQSVAPGVAAVYQVQLQNRGSESDAFVLRGGAGGSGWTVRYFTGFSGGTEITGQVTGAGFTTAFLAPSAALDFRVEATPDATVPGGSTKDLLLTATSVSDPAKLDAVRLITTALGVPATRQPDLLIRNKGDAAFVGDNVYNTTGAGQSRAQLVGPGGASVYEIRLQNDGNAADTFTLTGTGGATGWTVRYFTGFSGGTEITGQVTGAGFTTASLASGGTLDLRAEVAPGSTVPEGGVRTLLVTARSVGDSTKVDAVGASTTSARRRQPDLMIRVAGTVTYFGNNIYNSTGAGQTASTSVAVGSTAVYEYKVQNDSGFAQSYLVTGSAGGSGWTVRYFLGFIGSNEITSQITSAGWPTAVLIPGESVQLRIEVTPGSSVPGGSSRSVLVTGNTTGTPVQSDTVQAITTVIGVAATRRPDLLIRNKGDAAFVGDNVYNTTGAGQSKAQLVGPGGAAIYEIRLQNDGNAADTFTLTGTGGATGWTVRYFTGFSGGTEITGQVTGAGFTTASLASGGTLDLRAEVAPGSTVPEGGVRTLLVTARSVGDPTKVDAVGASTTSAKRRQPDLMIRVAGTITYFGNNIYNSTGAGQTASTSVAVSLTAVYEYKVQNDSGFAQGYLVTGSAGGSGWTVRYFLGFIGSNEITSQITSAGWPTAVLVPGESVQLRIEVTPGSLVPGGSSRSVLVTGNTTGTPVQSDTVQAITTRR